MDFYVVHYTNRKLFICGFQNTSHNVGLACINMTNLVELTEKMACPESEHGNMA